MEYFSKTTENAADLLNEVFQKLNATQSGLMQAKLQMWKELLWKMKLKLIYYLREIVNKITHLFVYMEEKILELALRYLYLIIIEEFLIHINYGNDAQRFILFLETNKCVHMLHQL